MQQIFAVLVLVTWATAAATQTPPQARNPGLERQRLAYFIGTWRIEGEVRQSIFGPAGKFSGSLRHEWILGRFFYITHHEERNLSGTHAAMAVTAYDSKKGVYTDYWFDDGGGVNRSEGTVSGNTWTWTTQYTVDGSEVKARTTITTTSPTTYDFTWELAPHGTDWMIVQTGKATKTKADE